MKFLFSVFLVFICSAYLFGQQPEIVVDFNSGSDNSFSEWNYKAITLNNKILLPLISTEFGEELGIVRNGNLRILKDIKQGTEGSKPTNFMAYKDEIYFVADDGINGSAIWKTDGSEVGTVLAIDPGDEPYVRPSDFIIAENGWLYYDYDDIIFRTDGTVKEKVYDDGDGLEYLSQNASTNYCKYKNGIAFITKNKDDSFSIIYIEGKKIIKLAKTDKAPYLAKAFGLATVADGLIFSVSEINNSDFVGMYVYKESSKSIEKLSIDGKNSPALRTIDFNESRNICWIEDNGYYGINGVKGEEELIFKNDNLKLIQGKRITNGIYEDKITFVANDGSFGDDILFQTDGTAAGTNKIKVLQPYYSDMLVSGKNGFIADGTSNLFNPRIFQINLESGDVTTIYEFNEDSPINSIRPVGIQDSYLYYISNLDLSVGAELYRIKVNLIVDTDETVIHDNATLSQNGNFFTIEMNTDENLKISFYNTLGQVVLQKEALSNHPFRMDMTSGYYLMRVNFNDKFIINKLVYINH